MYDYPRHRRPARHRVRPSWEHIRAALFATICLTLCLCAEGLVDTIFNLF